MQDNRLPTKAELFSLMCSTTASIMNYYTDLISIPAIAQIFNTTKYRVRKLMKELESEGLVKSGHESCYSDYNEQYYIVRGFCLTRAARETPEYKDAVERENRLVNEVFREWEEKRHAG